MALPILPAKDPLIIQSMKQWKAQLFQMEQTAVREATVQWVNVTSGLELRVQLLSEELARRAAQGEMLSNSKLFQLQRYQDLLAQAKIEHEKYASWVEAMTTKNQVKAGLLGTAQSVEAVKLAQAGAGRVIGSFNQLPVKAIENFAGFAADGSPLSQLLIQHWPDAAQAITQNLVQGVAEGVNPRDIAKMIHNGLDVALDRAMLIARTEPLRAYRSASQDTYQQSGVVSGYKRLSARDARVCPACLFADDGQLWPLDVPFEEHVCGRCTLVPEVEGLAPLTWQSGQEWFMTQPEETQRAILGPGRYDVWQSQKIDLAKFVSRREDATWGNSLITTKLSDLVEGKTGGAIFSAAVEKSLPSIDYNAAAQAELDRFDTIAETRALTSAEKEMKAVLTASPFTDSTKLIFDEEGNLAGAISYVQDDENKAIRMLHLGGLTPEAERKALEDALRQASDLGYYFQASKSPEETWALFRELKMHPTAAGELYESPKKAAQALEQLLLNSDPKLTAFSPTAELIDHGFSTDLFAERVAGTPEFKELTHWINFERADVLNRFEDAALDHYQGYGYTSINDYLRGERTATKKIKAEIEQISKAINKSVVPEDILAFRGVRLDQDFIDQLVPGATFSDPAFFSTSYDSWTAFNFATKSHGLDDYPVVFKLNVPAGSKGYFLRGSEAELLLQKGSNFKIVNSYYNSQNIFIVEGSLLP